MRIQGQSFADLSDAARGRLRNQALGFVYQFHHLLPEFTALENVAMPLLVRRLPVAEAEREARAASSSASASARGSRTARRSCRAASGSGRRSRARW